ncbi:MAG TPA: VWA domain-containing protein [Gemmataceae bacterium]|nr:VWA domain-containing protein [Gemmataceae bacterium]
MDNLRDLLSIHWFDSLLVVLALVFGYLFVRRWQTKQSWSHHYLLAAGACGLFGLGGLVVPFPWALWVLIAALVGWFGAILVVLMTGHWSASLGYTLAALFLLSSGAIAAEKIGTALVEIFQSFWYLEVVEPAWLVLLLLIPVIIWLSFRSLAGLGPVRRWLAIGLRCALILFLTLALAELRIRHPNETVTVLFLVDRSLSIPQELEPNPDNPSKPIDRRWERIKHFINDAVEHRGPDHKQDKAGVIVFGRRPRLELPPGEVKRLNFTEVTSPIDNTYTDIGGAIKLALASFPEGTGKRIVLLSDGNENLGNAEEQARIAKNNGVQIDVVPLAAGYRNDSEVLVQSVEAPPITEQSSHLPIRVLIRSHNPNIVVGNLTLKQITQVQDENGKITPVINPVPPSPLQVAVRPGLNPFAFKQTLTKQQQSYTYEAVFQPTHVVDDKGRTISEGLPLDRTENNRATTHVIAQGQRSVLLIQSRDNEHDLLLDQLRQVGGKSKFKVHDIVADKLPKDKEELGVFLSKYDCVLLANVPAELFSEDQMEMFRSNTHEQGCGLIMIGGPESFGAGGWQGTAVEKALPVDCDIKALKVQGKGGLVLIMHASEMDSGNMWQKKIAQLAIRKLSPMDEVGIIQFTWGGTKWHMPLQVISTKRDNLLKQVDKMIPEDMPEFDTALQMAHKDLMDPKRELATKHVIIISDGDPQQTNAQILPQMKKDKVTVTTVGVATHGAPQDQTMSNIARATGGRFYKVASPKALPAIYIKETRLVSQSFIYEKKFAPKLLFKTGPTEKLPDDLHPLYGYVRTTPKSVTPPVQVPILAPAGGDQEFPILAYWHYGLGKAVAFTSDARSQENKPYWDRDWAGSDMYLKFWEQVLDWSLRAVETGKLTMITEYRDGKVRVIVDARDGNNRPITDLKLKGGITPPTNPDGSIGKSPIKFGDLKFEQKNSGIYEAEFKADEAGSYFVNAQARRTATVTQAGKEVEIEEGIDSVRSGVTIPYSPEYADLESNAPLLEKLSTLTGGQSYQDDEETLAKASRSGAVFRLAGLPPSRSLQSIWYWLLMLTGIGLFFDVAVRRIAVDPREVVQAAQKGWARLRGRAVEVVPEAVFLERLKSRKAQIAEALQQTRSAKRFEVPESSVPPGAPLGADELIAQSQSNLPPRPIPQPRLEPKPEEEAADYTSRLLKAKKKVWQERDPESH